MLFSKALAATAKHRETIEQIKDIPVILETIHNSDALKAQWRKYQREYSYANEIKYEDVMNAIKELTDVL